ncbi:MAG: coenzyme F420-0:L-glutamate ligase [Candidatus Hodarchaeales archaeon]
MITIYPVENFPFIKKGDNVGRIIASRVTDSLKDGDIVIVTHKIVSRAEGREVNLKEITPSKFAINYANLAEKDPRVVELVLREAKSIVRNSDKHLITETKQGFICANSAVDRSNSPGDTAVCLPDDSDRSAREIRETIEKITGKRIAVIISDTYGRIFRIGTTNFAIGVSGMEPIEDLVGEKDLFDYELKTTKIARADELAAASGLIMGQSKEGYPVIIISGFKFKSGEGDINQLLRPREQSLFW